MNFVIHNNMLKVIEIKSQKEQECLEKFLKENKAPLLQSQEWGEFQKATGKKVWHLAVVEENFCAATQIIRHKLPFGKCYLYCPKGPIIEKSEIRNPKSETISNSKIQNILEVLIGYLKNLAQKEKAVFLRIEPEFLQNDQEKVKILKDLGFKKSQREIQPKDTLVLDLSLSEEELLKRMHPKTRYNIRLSEKRGVKIRQSIDQKDLEVFYNLLLKTANRDRFFSHPKEYYQKQLEILGRPRTTSDAGQENLVKLFLAEYQGKTIAGILVSFYNEKATYLHGAHDANFRNLMASHLLQWRAILEAKKRGYKIYDFWGVAPNGSPASHPWQGITRFKRGFGGKEVNYAGGWDWVFSPMWYWGYNLVHTIK